MSWLSQVSRLYYGRAKEVSGFVFCEKKYWRRSVGDTPDGTSPRVLCQCFKIDALDFEIGSFVMRRIAIVIRTVGHCKIKYRLYRKIDSFVLRVDLSELRHFIKCFDFNKYETIRAQTKHNSADNVLSVGLSGRSIVKGSVFGNMSSYIISIDQLTFKW